MAKIKDTADIARKYSRVTPGRQQDYVEGVEDPRADWEAQTLAAEKNFEQGIQTAVAEKRFSKGVKKAGTIKWQRQTLLKGPSRWAASVADAGEAYAEGFRPYAEVISKLELPPRGPVGSPQNLLRVNVIAKALHDKKKELLARA
jgi:hypothetical protein